MNIGAMAYTKVFIDCYYQDYYQEIKEKLLTIDIPEQFQINYNNLVFEFHNSILSLINNNISDSFDGTDFRHYYYKALQDYSKILNFLDLLGIESSSIITDYSYLKLIENQIYKFYLD
ncbi:MAG: hypothetical protein ACRCUM_02500 [Mycoplasmoidaceae bacterium]